MTSNMLMARFAGEPALVEPAAASRFEACLNLVAGHPKAKEMISGELMRGEDYWQEDGGWCRPYVVQDGILQIPVKGVLLNNFPYALYDWATGYDYIWEAFKRGCADYSIGVIRGIALVCDTPGGMVAGCFDMRDKMIALKNEVGVPVAGFAHESAYSAGYATITVADPGQIYVSRTGGVGSIGVVTGHMSVAGAMEKAGFKFTYIFAGEGKTDGNPYEDLSDDAKARIQARIDELYGIFVSAVAVSRGLDEAKIRDELGAHCFTASQATSNGLADKVGSLEDATAAFAAFLDEPSDNQGEEDMSTQDTSAVDQAASNARAEGEKTGAAAMQARIGAILASDEAKGREEQAQHLAFKTIMSAEDAIGVLATAPKAAVTEPAATTETDGKPANFEGAMSGTSNPEVGANANHQGGEQKKDDGSDLRTLAGRVGLKGFAATRK